mmetsp:Transcript_25678/g.59340  ORF Transcript_25678/g.59340 Transcript_25678/m.59340 type:complete len:339 (-) Transcript_25678:27-1043(-)
MRTFCYPIAFQLSLDSTSDLHFSSVYASSEAGCTSGRSKPFIAASATAIKSCAKTDSPLDRARKAAACTSASSALSWSFTNFLNNSSAFEDAAADPSLTTSCTALCVMDVAFSLSSSARRSKSLAAASCVISMESESTKVVAPCCMSLAFDRFCLVSSSASSRLAELDADFTSVTAGACSGSVSTAAGCSASSVREPKAEATSAASKMPSPLASRVGNSALAVSESRPCAAANAATSSASTPPLPSVSNKCKVRVPGSSEARALCKSLCMPLWEEALWLSAAARCKNFARARLPCGRHRRRSIEQSLYGLDISILACQNKQVRYRIFGSFGCFAKEPR